MDVTNYLKINYYEKNTVIILGAENCKGKAKAGAILKIVLQHQAMISELTCCLIAIEHS